jgi:hypothetical protein
MIQKQSVTIHKAWLNVATMALLLSAFIARLKTAVTIQIPTGYQDETGFHMGVKSAGKEVKWPSVW